MNEVKICGRLVRDPKILDNSCAPVVFCIAVKNEFNDKVEFLNCMAWGRHAEIIIADNYLKGDKICVIGHLKNNNYIKDGKAFYSVVIEIERIISNNRGISTTPSYSVVDDIE